MALRVQPPSGFFLGRLAELHDLPPYGYGVGNLPGVDEVVFRGRLDLDVAILEESLERPLHGAADVLHSLEVDFRSDAVEEILLLRYRGVYARRSQVLIMTEKENICC